MLLESKRFISVRLCAIRWLMVAVTLASPPTSASYYASKVQREMSPAANVALFVRRFAHRALIGFYACSTTTCACTMTNILTSRGHLVMLQHGPRPWRRHGTASQLYRTLQKAAAGADLPDRPRHRTIKVFC